ncbi:DUF3017 domain-containing protein [Bifidobacterium sp. UBA744]|uniref:DUF3017 domain-containing protein n=1 Tax=Bifidobacterium sp. UBA744 TaxID=1946112 RepID=UPI0025BAD7B0|nr:DUF3017 domain-containing protein [Bifidobacterium sp. UBA744]
MNSQHPFVSEAHEGNPLYEWGLLVVVGIAAIVAVTGHVQIAVAIVALESLVSGCIRMVMKQRSPFKVRSVAFDVFISIALGLGLIVLDIALRAM